MTDGAKAGSEGIRPVDKRPERSPRCIERARARRWNGVLSAAMVGGDVTPSLSLT